MAVPPRIMPRFARILPNPWLFFGAVGALALPCFGCGARTGLDLAGADWAAGGGAGAGDDGGAAGAGGGSGSGGDAGTSAGGGGNIGDGGGAVLPGDRCAAAVAGPKAMRRNCSTRDGRSRVSAPTSPHITWVGSTPSADEDGLSLQSAIATDSAGHAYLTTIGADAMAKMVVERLETTDGTLDWQNPLWPNRGTGTPLLLATGSVDLFAYDDATDDDELFAYDPSAGSYSLIQIGGPNHGTIPAFRIDDFNGDPAVGTDGSLYLVHQDGIGGGMPTNKLSRLAQDGTVFWTTADFQTLSPPPYYAGSLASSNVALSDDDLVVVATLITTQTQDYTTLIAFDPASGSPRWTTTVTGELLAGPAVRADGTIVVIVQDISSSTNQLATFDPKTGAQAVYPIATAGELYDIFAITAGGVVISGTFTGEKQTRLVAVGTDGAVLWESDGADNATIANDGTIVAAGTVGDSGTGASIRAIDPVTGTTKWEVAAPSGGSCVADFALTSAGGVVALQCDGTVFGVGD
jgi:hypothetical protein